MTLKTEKAGKGNAMIVTAMQLDEWVDEFLRSNQTAVVLNLCFGLVARVSSSLEMKKGW